MTQLILSGLTTYSIQTNKNRIRHISASSHKKGTGVWGAEYRGLYSQSSSFVIVLGILLWNFMWGGGQRYKKIGAHF